MSIALQLDVVQPKYLNEYDTAIIGNINDVAKVKALRIKNYEAFKMDFKEQDLMQHKLIVKKMKVEANNLKLKNSLNINTNTNTNWFNITDGLKNILKDNEKKYLIYIDSNLEKIEYVLNNYTQFMLFTKQANGDQHINADSFREWHKKN